MQSQTSKLDYELLISLCNIVFNLVHFAMLHLISFTLQSLESIYNYLHIFVQFTNFSSIYKCRFSRCDALSFAQLVVAAKQQMQLSGGGRYGIRGAYTEPKSKDFFDLLLYQFSEWWFKAWLGVGKLRREQEGQERSTRGTEGSAQTWHVAERVAQASSRGRVPQVGAGAGGDGGPGEGCC
jgi:hypothetical protein